MSKRLIALFFSVGFLAGCASKGSEVVIYSSLDGEFSEPIMKDFQSKSGIRVIPKFDAESTKTVGLTQSIIAEAPRPRCDLFWNNEILNTLRLKEKGLLVPFHPKDAGEFPAVFRDKDAMWYGFAARARILLVNTKLVPESERPRGIMDLIDPKWKGKIGMAKPLFGTTATHAACLFASWGDEKARSYYRDLKANKVQILSGNKQVAQAVGAGSIAIGITDTDDAMEEIAAGSPVAIVYPDRESTEIGTLFIPNTLAMIRGGPHPEQAAKFADFLLSAEVETTLAKGPSAQIPLNPKASGARVETPKTVHAMPTDFEAAAKIWDKVAAFLAEEFAGG